MCFHSSIYEGHETAAREPQIHVPHWELSEAAKLPCRTCFGKLGDDGVRGEAGSYARCYAVGVAELAYLLLDPIQMRDITIESYYRRPKEMRLKRVQRLF